MLNDDLFLPKSVEDIIKRLDAIFHGREVEGGALDGIGDHGLHIALERTHIGGELLDGRSLGLVLAAVEVVRVGEELAGKGIQVIEELVLGESDGAGNSFSNRADVSTAGTFLVIQTRNHDFVTESIDVVQALLFVFDERVEREVENNGENETEQGRIERRAETAGHDADRGYDGRDIFDIAELHARDRVRQTDNRSDKAEERDRPEEGFGENITAHDSGAIDRGLTTHHRCDMADILTDLEKLEGLADAVHHHAVTKLRRQPVDVVNKITDIRAIDLTTELHGEHVEQKGAVLMLKLEPLQGADRGTPEEEQGIRKADREVFVKQIHKLLETRHLRGI